MATATFTTASNLGSAKASLWSRLVAYFKANNSSNTASTWADGARGM